MDGMYGFQPTCDYSDKAGMMMLPDNLMFPSDYQTLLCSSAGDNRVSDVFGSDELFSVAASATMSSGVASMAPGIRRNDGNVSLGVIKAKIACHPAYPRLLQAYMDCQKVIYTKQWLRIIFGYGLLFLWLLFCISCLFPFLSVLS